MKHRKKPVVIEAFQWDGRVDGFTEDWFVDFLHGPGQVVFGGQRTDAPWMVIKTLEGDMQAQIGDWIIKGIHGELYPCKPEIFSKTYDPVCDQTCSFNFGYALIMLKNGHRVARAGWNGKGMWLAYQKAYPAGIPINQNTAEATGIPEGTICKFLPYLMMKTVDNSFVPWLASQTDILAEDWEVVE